MKRMFLVGAMLFAGLTAAMTSGQTPTAVAPRLVLVLSIDQMRFDYLTRFDALFTGGLRTLLDRGAVFSNALYRHSASETGPGHSVILSGRHPSHSGIVANEWYDWYLQRMINVVEDEVQRPLGGAGRAASPTNFAAFTVGDVLKANSPQSKVVGVALKDRSAVLMAGRRADGAYWYETTGGNFITSTYYASATPAWLAAWNARRLPDGYAGRTWMRLLPDTAVYERYAGKDAIEGEWDRKDIVFPHAIRLAPPAQGFYDGLRRTPFADLLTYDVAMEAMKAHHLGEDAATDIFAIGFSATDIIGHTYGADSQEQMDQLLRLDGLLQQLFAEIDARVGLANTLVVLTADHGSMPLVENLQAKGIDAKRAAPSALADPVNAALTKKFPEAKGLVSSFSAPDFYFSPAVMREKGLNRKDVEDTAISALMGTGLVAKVYTHDDLRSTQPSSDPFLPLFRNAFYETRSPHLSVLLKPYVYLNSLPGGTGHGTAYEWDRHVPVIFMGAGIKRGVYSTLAGPEDIAPTLAHTLGLAFPIENDSRLLLEMLPEIPALK